MSRTTKRLGSKTATSQNIYRILNLSKNSKLWLFRQIFDFIFWFHRKKNYDLQIFAEDTVKLRKTSSSLYDLNRSKFQKISEIKTFEGFTMKEGTGDYSKMYTYLTSNNHKCKLNVKSSVSDIWKIEKVEMSFELPHKIRKNIHTWTI